MNRTDCKLERVSNLTVGLILMGVGLLFTLTGITVLPVIGLMIAVPVLQVLSRLGSSDPAERSGAA